MPSPFPGMDPYLEEPSVFYGLQLSLLVTVCEELNRSLPKHLGALMREEDHGLGKPHRYICVNPLKKQDGAITIVELIGPQHRVEGKAREAYLKRRKQRAAKESNWVEVALCRRGERLPPHLAEAKAALSKY